MAKSVGRPLTILLHGDTSGLAKSLQQAQGNLNKFSNSVDAMARKATIAFAGLAVAGGDAARAAADDQAAAAQLALTMRNVTRATQSQINSTEDFITKMALAKGVSDEELRPALSRLIRSTGDVAEAQRVLNVALDVSKSIGKPVEEVANAIGKAYDGNTTALSRLGLGIDKNILKTGDMTKIMAVLEASTRGASDVFAQTGAGSLARLSVAIDEAKEAIGYGLLPVVTKLANTMQTWTPFIQRNSNAIANAGLAAAGAAASIMALKVATDALKFTMALTTRTLAVTKLAVLTLATATGSATAAQNLALLSYGKSASAAKLYTAAIAVQTVAVKVATGAMKLFTLSLLTNPITALAVALTIATVALVRFAATSRAVGGSTKADQSAYQALGNRFQYVAHSADKAASSVAKLAAVTAASSMQSRDAARANGRTTTSFVSMSSVIADINSQMSKFSKSTASGGGGASKIAKTLSASAQAFKDYRDQLKSAITSQIDFARALEDKGTGSFVASLQKQADAAKQFGGKIAKLVSMGLSRGALSQIVSAGAVAGSQIADELISGGAASVRSVNAAISSVEAVSSAVSGAATMGVSGRGNAAIGAGAVNITINGAVDPEGVRRQLEKLFQQSSRRTGAFAAVGGAV